MDTAKLKKFAQFARRSLMEQVAGKLKLVLSKESAARREYPQAVQELEAQISTLGKELVIEKVAYTWFNRFCALRFMDVNRYNRVGLVSPAEGQFQPEILAEAKMGHIDEEMVPDRTRRQIFALLDGTQPSPDPHTEAYRLLLVAACNDYHKAMPYLFQRIDDFTELLIPDDLLSGSSTLAYTREALTPDACTDVEVIGWLYQFYISEKKDEVFEGLKKNKKITPENIPAATQLFTPHWIVRYLVENSLGRLWMLNRPHSKLIDQMDYYIQPEEPETEFLKIGSPEEIKICDPACGSGHMLTYAFELLHAIYEEEGYEASEIPEKILTHNLYGVEIDERAGELAAFALTMKARARQRRFFGRGCKPKICVLQSVHFEGEELTAYMDFVGRDLFTFPLLSTLRQFEEANNFGSLIRPEVNDVAGMIALLEAKRVSGDLFLNQSHQRVLQVLRQADFLSPKYHVVIANPPYMDGSGANPQLSAWTKEMYPHSKSNLFAMFIERSFELTQAKGFVSMITMQSWMFLSSFEQLRTQILESSTLYTMAHLGARAFDSFGGEVVSTTAFVARKILNSTQKGVYMRLTDGMSEAEKSASMLTAIREPDCGWLFRACSSDFKRIPGSPVAYWVTEPVRLLFATNDILESQFEIKAGICTGRNEEFILSWPEVSFGLVRSDFHVEYAYTPHNKGGEFRKWLGNWDSVLKYSNVHVAKMEKNRGFRHDGKEYYFREHIGWTKITSSRSSFRYYPPGFTFDSAGLALFGSDTERLEDTILFLNSKVSAKLIEIINPTLNVTPQVLKKLPFIPVSTEQREVFHAVFKIAQTDWDSFELSWRFECSPLLKSDYPASRLSYAYRYVRSKWSAMCLETKRLEEENNLFFIEACGLGDEFTSEVPVREISLTCNPWCRYGQSPEQEVIPSQASGVEDDELDCKLRCSKLFPIDSDLEYRLLADTMKEFISYAVGCMLGRYALDKPGLILANQGETIEDYYSALEVTECSVDPHSVQLRQGSNAHCFNCALAMEHGGALFVLRRYEANQFAGRPMVYCKRCAEEHVDLFTLPLAEFCYKTAITQQWSERSTLEQFLELAQCFDYEAVKDKRDAVSFPADEDNVIPIIDGDWFADDITERFYNFLRVTFGETHFEENLQFLEKAIGKDVRKYFLKDFYNDHVKRYKKRPIYWLFSSPKGSFNALIYMHRYRPDTVSVVLNNYLREFRTKLSARKGHLETLSISASASQGEKTKALKEIEKLNKVIEEMEDYERDVLYPLATEQIAIDLDDGVKVNYLKFGAALKKIAGLDKTED